MHTKASSFPGGFSLPSRFHIPLVPCQWDFFAGGGALKTKILAKLAAHEAKRYPSLNGVLDFEGLADPETLLASLDVGEVWGLLTKLSLRTWPTSTQTQLKLNPAETMPNYHRPGQNIRQLAQRRRAEAVRSFFAAVTVGAFLVIITFYFTALPIYVYALGACSIGAFMVVSDGAWRQADRADQGAEGEETIGRDLNSLQRSGWQIEYGRRLPFVGDVDIICRSPRGQVFAIDVKSHRGTVVHNRGQLRRQVGNSQYPFEKDFLGQVKHQAVQIKEADNYSYVTPVLVFSRAKVNVSGGKAGNVYVVARQDLRSLLLNQG